MKVYTNEAHLFGRTVKVLNETVTFDNLGCAEIEDKLAKRIIDYSEWFSAEKKEVVVVEKPKTIDEELADQEVEILKAQLEKFKKQDESRKGRMKDLEKEVNDIRTDMGKVVEERDTLKKQLETKEELWNKQKEGLEYKFQLALMEVDELKDMCKKLGLKEEDYSKKRKKEPLIELIINAAQ